MQQPQHRYLRPADLARLRHVVFRPRRPVEGRYAGRHASPQQGRSVEFTDYRPYLPGDEPGVIDWKAYARSDRLIVKRFEHRAEMTVHLLLDASASMGYSGVQGPGSEVQGRGGRMLESKYDYGARLAAAIGFLVVHQQDKVSFGVARDGLVHAHRPGGAMVHLRGILDSMERVEPGGEADLAGALRRVAGGFGRGGVLVLVSDLLDEPGPILQALTPFIGRGGEVIVFHVMHEDELHLPNLEDALLTDSETGASLALNVADVRPAYEKRLRGFLDEWSAAFRVRGIDYNLVSTAMEYHKALEKYLFQRTAKTG